MQPYLKLQFGKSNSKIFEKVVRMAAKYDGYSLSEGIHRIVFSRENLMLKWDEFYKIYALTANWKSFLLFLNGIEIPADKFNRLVGKIAEVQRCFQRSFEYGFKEYYCGKNPFGCLNLTAVNINPNAYGNFWYLYGHFENGTKKWIIHKKEIELMIQKEIEIKQLHFCPVFTTDKIEKIINSFPDFIDLEKESESWEIVYEKRFAGTAIIDVPVSIKHVMKKEQEMDVEIEEMDEEETVENNLEVLPGETEKNPFGEGCDDWANWEIDNFKKHLKLKYK